MSANFDRQYRMLCGPAGCTGFEIGTGLYPLHVKFSFEKSDLTTQNTGKVSVWNLNDSHLAMLDEKDCVVSLKAGYGGRISEIFTGIVSHVETDKNGADVETAIEVIDNLVEVRDTFISLSYNGTVNWKTIMDDAANQMGIVPTYSYNAEFRDCAGGFSFVGQAKDVFDKGCACCGLNWSMQNGIIQVKKPGDVMSKEVYLLSEHTGLIGIPKKVTIGESETKDKNAIGWDVTYFLNGAINVDDYVKLESNKISGYFRVQSIKMEGDNVSGDWTCTARLLELTEESGGTTGDGGGNQVKEVNRGTNVNKNQTSHFM